MSKREPGAALKQMLAYAREASAMIARRSRSDLDSDRQLELALTRLVEIVGEAATRVTTEERARLPGIPWSQVVGFRNRLIHAYDAVDLDVLWSVIEDDLPVMIAVLAGALPASPGA